MATPLSDNCQAYRLDASGKVVGVNLDAYANPKTKYKLHSVALRDEYAAQGQTIARVTVLGQDKVQTQAKVALLWPYEGHLQEFPYSAVKDVFTPMEHMVMNGYAPPNPGPLAIAVMGDDGKVDSDVIAGLGLPFGHHVSYEIVFIERTARQIIDPSEPEQEEAIPRDAVRAALIAIRQGIDSIIDALN